MTPEGWAALGAIVERFGLPIAILAAFGWLVLKRKLVTGTELERMTALYERERLDRIAAESIIAKVAPASAEVAEAVADLSATVMARLPILEPPPEPPPDPRSRPYNDRLEGTRRRGR
jgi:hypothetical protein